MSFVCSHCGYQARDNYNLKRHVATHGFVKLTEGSFDQSHDDKPKTEVTCFHCYRAFSRKSALVVHAQRHLAPNEEPGRLKCPLCSSKFRDKCDIEGHFIRAHRVKFEKTRLTFNRESDFYEWKSEMEESSMSSYAMGRGRQSHNGRVYMYYQCFRSGSCRVKPMESRKRLSKLLGTPKMGAYCPGRIDATILKDGRIKVTYCSTHVGHDFAVARLPLTKEYRKSLAIQMRMNIPIDAILATERGKAQLGSKQLLRSMFLTRQDLHNVAREFMLRDAGSVQFCTSGATLQNHDSPSSSSDHESSSELIAPNNNLKAKENVVNSALCDNPAQPSSNDINVKKEILKLTKEFVEVVKKATNLEALAAVRKSLLSLDAAIESKGAPTETQLSLDERPPTNQSLLEQFANKASETEKKQRL